jgi:hypothetical protein
LIDVQIDAKGILDIRQQSNSGNDPAAGHSEARAVETMGDQPTTADGKQPCRIEGNDWPGGMQSQRN